MRLDGKNAALAYKKSGIFPKGKFFVNFWAGCVAFSFFFFTFTAELYQNLNKMRGNQSGLTRFSSEMLLRFNFGNLVQLTDNKQFTPPPKNSVETSRRLRLAAGASIFFHPTFSRLAYTSHLSCCRGGCTIGFSYFIACPPANPISLFKSLGRGLYHLEDEEATGHRGRGKSRKPAVTATAGGESTGNRR